MLNILKKRRYSKSVEVMYTCAMAMSRAPTLYTDCEVPDTPTSRYEMLMMHLSALFWRIGGRTLHLKDGVTDNGQLKDVSDWRQEAYDFMFHDVEVALREMGTGDSGVGRKIKRMASAFHGRCRAYDSVWDACFLDRQGESNSDVEGTAEEDTVQTQCLHNQLIEVLVHNVFPEASPSEQAIQNLAKRTLRLAEVALSIDHDSIISADTAAVDLLTNEFTS